MTQFTKTLADAYVRPARSVMLPSTPGRQVRFMQGHAVLNNDRDVIALMRRNDVKIVLTPYAMSWAESWFSEVGERIQAEILIPDDAQPPDWDPDLRSVIVGADSTGSDPRTE